MGTATRTGAERRGPGAGVGAGVVSAPSRRASRVTRSISSGPALSRVARVSSVQTDPLTLKPEVGTNSYRLQAYVNDGRVRFQDSPQVTVKVTVKAALGKK